MKPEHIELIDESAETLVLNWKSQCSAQIDQLIESIQYSYTRGGKRFRPSLSLMVADVYAAGPKRVLPWALAVEMIHTYSLIHDDLPCMDNDDFRRGQPTNHKVFGETTALLAGDALLTEAFHLIAQSYRHEPETGLRLVQLLGEASGIQGMIAGQMIDILSQKKAPQRGVLEEMHRLKTGALIRVAAEGAAVICGLEKEKVSLWRQFGEKLGLAFQVKDDLLDAVDKKEMGSYPEVIGLEETNHFLLQLNSEMKAIFQKLEMTSNDFDQLIEYNFQRTK